MALSIVNPCDGDIIDPVCDPCLGDVEHGRIRSSAYAHKSVLGVLQPLINALEAALNAVPVVPATVTAAKVALQEAWNDGVADKFIYVIPETTGTFDGGAPVEGPGYGDRDSRVVGYNFGLAYKDPVFKKNAGFYNTIPLSSGWYFIWRTETLTRISNNPVTVLPKSPVQEDLNSEVVWEVDVKWKGKSHPLPFSEMIDLFTCPNP